MKTFDKKDVYSWSNCEEAKTYIGKTGYFNNDFESIKRAIELGDPAVLDRVDTNSIWCFKALGVSLCFGLFLPADKVKEVEEKKYRPFKNVAEFKKYIYGDYCVSCIEQTIKIEDINTSEIYELMIVGAFVNGLVLPLYGALTMEELFRKFKLKFNDQFLPFGVEE